MSNGSESSTEKYNSKFKILKGNNKKTGDAIFSDITVIFTLPMCENDLINTY